MPTQTQARPKSKVFIRSLLCKFAHSCRDYPSHPTCAGGPSTRVMPALERALPSDQSSDAAGLREVPVATRTFIHGGSPLSLLDADPLHRNRSLVGLPSSQCRDSITIFFYQCGLESLAICQEAHARESESRTIHHNPEPREFRQTSPNKFAALPPFSALSLHSTPSGGIPRHKFTS